METIQTYFEECYNGMNEQGFFQRKALFDRFYGAVELYVLFHPEEEEKIQNFIKLKQRKLEHKVWGY